jgi:hypothetical protein
MVLARAEGKNGLGQIVAIQKMRRAMRPLRGQVSDAKCMKEFWAKNQPVQAWIEATAEPPRAVMAEFRDWCSGLVERHGATPETLTILSDAPHYDLGRLSHLGYVTQSWRLPVEYLGTLQRFYAADPSGRRQEHGASTSDYERWLQARGLRNVRHSHFPDDDAEYNAYEWLFCEDLRRLPAQRYSSSASSSESSSAARSMATRVSAGMGAYDSVVTGIVTMGPRSSSSSSSRLTCCASRSSTACAAERRRLQRKQHQESQADVRTRPLVARRPQQPRPSPRARQ